MAVVLVQLLTSVSLADVRLMLDTMQLGWDHHQTDGQLLPVLKRMDARRQQQPEISAFFGRTAQVCALSFSYSTWDTIWI